MSARAILEPRTRPFLWVAFALMLAVLAGAVYANALRGVPVTDFVTFYAAVKADAKDLPLYSAYSYAPGRMDEPMFAAANPGADERSNNLNAPVMTLLMNPFAQLDMRTSYYVWGFVQMLVGLGVWLIFLRRFFPDEPSALPLGGLALTLYFPVFANQLVGEVGLWYFAALAGALLAYRAGRGRLCGLLLGVALAMKLFTGLIFIWLLLMRRWRPLAFGALAYAGLMLLGLLVFGVANHVGWLEGLRTVNWHSYTWNGSLEGFLARSFGGSPRQALVDWPLFRMSVRVIVWALAFGALLWLARRRDERTFQLGLAAVLPLMLLLSPLAWIYYFPVLLLAAILARPLVRPGLWAFGLMLSGLPQYLGLVERYAPSFWKPHYYGIIGGTQGQPAAWKMGNYWFDFCEGYTLALFILAALPLWTAYKERSAHTGA